eukprot:scaffold1371_cov132-Skeletonema_menzelii.AAC.4
MKPSTIMLSDEDNGHPAASKEPVKPAVISPIRRITEEEQNYLLHPLTVHSGNITPPSPPLYSADYPSSYGADMISSPRKNLKKPKRPLTAYHIYFQIEREFIIQTMAGDDADKSIHEGKIFFNDVPKRYVNTKLSPDWYFAPGKRSKRKHRKQHGKIGFLELSRVITSRWATLEETDPDIKQYVSMLAQRENEEYKREMKEYRDNLAKSMMIVPTVNSKSNGSSKQQPAPQVHQREDVTMMPQYDMMEYHHQAPPRISSFPLYNEDRFFTTNPTQRHQEAQLPNEVEFSYQQRTFAWGKPQPDDDFDHCISLISSRSFVSPEQHPSRRDRVTSSPSSFDPLTFLDDRKSDYMFEPATKKQRVDDLSAYNFVDICDDDILSMWKSTNSE